MTTLLERIDADSKAALRAGNRDLRRLLAFVYAEARAIGKDATPPRDTTDEEVVRVLRKQIANLEENARLTEGSPAATVYRAEAQIIAEYLPAQMPEQELRDMIRSFCTGQNWTDEKPSMKWMGDVMSMLRECHPGKYDPAMASRIAREVLTELAAS